MIKLKVMKIDKEDVNKVAKAIILDDSGRVLFLKRSNYVEKYANEWDLPGGHLKRGESLEQGLEREVKEETGLTIKDSTYFRHIEQNLHFYIAKFSKEDIILSNEHTEFKFFNKSELKKSEKFQKIALDALAE